MAHRKFQTNITTRPRQPAAMHLPTRTPFCLGAESTFQAVSLAHSRP